LSKLFGWLKTVTLFSLSLTGWTAAAIICRVGDLSGMMSNVNYSWLKGTKCVNWRYIWPVFNQLSLTLHGARLRPSSLLMVRVASSSESRNPHDFAFCTLCARPSVNVERRIVGASDSARDILCLPNRNIADTSASRYIVANCWPLLPILPDITIDCRRLGSTGWPAIDQIGKKRTTTTWRSIVSLFFYFSNFLEIIHQSIKQRREFK